MSRPSYRPIVNGLARGDAQRRYVVTDDVFGVGQLARCANDASKKLEWCWNSFRRRQMIDQLGRDP
jgi:hypothetical protein